MYEEALKFLFYRKEYKDLLKLIEHNYLKEKKTSTEGLKFLVANKLAGNA